MPTFPWRRTGSAKCSRAAPRASIAAASAISTRGRVCGTSGWSIPREKSLEAFELDRGRWTLTGTVTGHVAAHIPPFDAIEMELGRSWGG